MKKIIITIIFLSFSIALFAKAYTSYNNVHTSDDTPRLSYYNYDTLQYITRDFNDSQNVYLNKPLKDLLKKVIAINNKEKYLPGHD